jgi:hypothetical protein
VAEQEKEAVQRYGDYTESIERLTKETPQPPTPYLHMMMNTSNAPDVGYYLSKHPEVVAKLWGLEASGQGVKVIEEINHIPSDLRFQGNTAQTGAGAAARREHRPERWDYRGVTLRSKAEEAKWRATVNVEDWIDDSARQWGAGPIGLDTLVAERKRGVETHG